MTLAEEFKSRNFSRKPVFIRRRADADMAFVQVSTANGQLLYVDPPHTVPDVLAPIVSRCAKPQLVVVGVASYV
jgi:hypothetical protein